MEKTTILFNSVRLFESFEKAPTQKAVKKSGLKVNETEPNEQIAWENNKRLTRGNQIYLVTLRPTLLTQA